MDKIREIYIPAIVKDVISKKKPKTDQEFIEFSQALYDQVEKQKSKLNTQKIFNN